MNKKILFVIGARPQFIKHAPIELAFSNYFDCITVHTGQHYDDNMSQIFFSELKIKKPTYMLSVGSSNHGTQTGSMMIKIEEIVEKEKPDAILVYGDTNSTLAGALVGAKLHIPVIHIEAGLRSFNKKMPEEINRVLTDHVSSLLFVPSSVAVENLKKEGIYKNVEEVGDVMIDMIKIASNRIKIDKQQQRFIYVTIHRPYNTDDNERLKNILHEFNELGEIVKFSIHPRTKNRLKEIRIKESDFQNIQFLPPVSYFENVKNLLSCEILITDSGGMQKEAYALKKQCITIRTETEWIETLEGNWNTLIFDNLAELKTALKTKPNETLYKEDLYGDGSAATHILKSTINFLQ